MNAPKCEYLLILSILPYQNSAGSQKNKLDKLIWLDAQYTNGIGIWAVQVQSELAQPI